MRRELDGDGARVRWAGEGDSTATPELPVIADDRPAGRLIRLWIPLPVAIVLGVAAVVAGALLVSQSVPGAAFVLVLFMLAPGFALIRLLGLRDPPLEAILSIALSLALAGIVATVQAYVGAWSPSATVAVLLVTTVGALFARPLLALVSRLLPRLTVRFGRVGTISRPLGRATGSAAATFAGPIRATPAQGLSRMSPRIGELPAAVRSFGLNAGAAAADRSSRPVAAAPPSLEAAPGLFEAVVSSRRIVEVTPLAVVSTRRTVDAATTLLRRTAAIRPALAEAPIGSEAKAGAPRRKAPRAAEIVATAPAKPARKPRRAGLEPTPAMDKELAARPVGKRAARTEKVAARVPVEPAERTAARTSKVVAPVAAEPAAKKTPRAAAPVAAAPAAKKTARAAAPVAAAPAAKKTPRAAAPVAAAPTARRAGRIERRAEPVAAAAVAKKLPRPEAPVAPAAVAKKTPRADKVTARVAAEPVAKRTARTAPVVAPVAAEPIAKKAPRTEAPVAAPPVANKAPRTDEVMPSVAPEPAPPKAPRAAATTRPRPRTPDETQELPPPPVAVIHRRSRGGEPGSESAPRRRGPLGADALAESGATRTFRSAIDHVVDDLAEQRNRSKR